jgi:ergothioneine biosynthesis protein EgtB
MTTTLTAIAPVTKTEIRDELEAAWRLSDYLFEMIGEDNWLTQPIPLRHPFIFYLGHLPAFAYNQLERLLNCGPHHETFDKLFERGIDPLSEESRQKSQISQWPEVAEVVQYRNEVRDRLRAMFDDVAERATGDRLADKYRIYHVVLEHEQMHHETLLYMIHETPTETLHRPADWPDLVTGAARLTREPVDVKAGPVRLGAEFHEMPFLWDNETPSHTVHVDRFTIDSLPITVGEYAEFITSGGYTNPDFWSEADWRWRESAGLAHPQSWRRKPDGGFDVRSLFEWLPASQVSGWPVFVSHAEAAAYARYAGKRLPTEPELQRAAYTSPTNGETHWPWGYRDVTPDRVGANLGFAHGAPLPVGTTPDAASAWGVHELVGNGYEWTSTPFAPLPGYEAWVRTYPGYSADFFDDQHVITFGGSWATSWKLSRRSFRNWFQRHYPYTFTTFRLVH